MFKYNSFRCSDNPGLCSGHICLNTKGHFKCECHPGYELRDFIYCKATDKEKASLLFAHREDIRHYDITSKRPHHYSLYSKLRAAIALDFSIKGNYLIWSDVADKIIYIAKLSKDKRKFKIQFKISF